MDRSVPSPELTDRFRRDFLALAGTGDWKSGIALSGGPDSSALLLLAAAAFPGMIEAATFDHRLRPESGAEAMEAAALCERLSIPHQILVPDDAIGGNLQAGAREARYRRLEMWRQERGLDWILTGHHQDDQAETLLMRLNRGSGIAGQSAIRARNGNRLRPLLGWRRAELERIIEAAGIVPARDPSNHDPRFDRTRIREAIARSDWVDPAGLARSAAAAAEAEQALQYSSERLFAERGAQDGHELRLDPRGLPAEYVRRLVLRALRHVDPQAAPRGEELGRMIERLKSGEITTLAGVKATGGDIWRFEPAPARRSG